MAIWGYDTSDVIFPEHIDNSTKFVLVNTVYFKPRWLHIFDEKDTEQHAFLMKRIQNNTLFYASKTKRYLVPTMFKNSIYKYGIIKSWRCRFIEIPYLASNCHFFLNFRRDIISWNLLVRTHVF